MLLLLAILLAAEVPDPSPVCAGDQTRATVERVIDGDTVVVNPMLIAAYGRYQLAYFGPVRLLHIDAPELRDPGGQESKTFLGVLLPAGSRVCLRALPPDAFGRPLVVINLPAPATGTVNEAMVASGHAVRRP
jgi:endonuclease YncB( thermonuclease family)